MMARMDAAERAQWFRGVKAQQTIDRIHNGAFHCDDCESRAVAISHQGTGSAVRVECSVHFLARLAADRAVRPSRAELVARVNASVRA